MATGLHGNGGVVKSSTDVIALVQDWAVDGEGRTAECSGIGDLIVTDAIGQLKYTGSLNCQWSPGDTGQDSLVLGATVTLELALGTTVGSTNILGQALITGESNAASKDDIVTKNLSFTMNTIAYGVTV